MFVRTKRLANKDGSVREYLQLVETRREKGRVRQHVIATLGRADELRQSGQLDRLLEGLARYSTRVRVLDATKELRAESAKEYGPALVFSRLWERLGIGRHLQRLLARTKVEGPLGEAAFAMVLNRLSAPRSKLGVHRWRKEIYWPAFDAVELHHLYRALDFLADHQTEIEQRLWDAQRDLFHQSLDLVLFDTTSTYFEGVRLEGFARYGHSKDHRPDRLEVVIGVLMTREGIPVAHEVFPGNQADPVSFRQAFERLKKDFQIGRVILVGDRGMVSEATLSVLRQEGMAYIVGERMRTSTIGRKAVRHAGRYHPIRRNLWVKEAHGLEEAAGDRILVCYNPEEARRQKLTRRAMLRRLEEKLASGGAKSLVGHSGYRRYLVVEGKVRIDRKKAAAEAVYDGKYVLRTNALELSPEEIALAYRDLWRVERAFREPRSTLDLRPVFHWTERRVRGHIFVCFLALVLESALRRLLKEQGLLLRWYEVMDALRSVRAIDLELAGQRYLVRTELGADAARVFQAAGVRPPSQVTPL